MSIKRALIQTRGDVFAAALLVETMASPFYSVDRGSNVKIGTDIEKTDKFFKLKKPFIEIYNKIRQGLSELGVDEINSVKLSTEKMTPRMIQSEAALMFLPILRAITSRREDWGVTLGYVSKLNALTWLVNYKSVLLGRESERFSKLTPGLVAGGEKTLFHDFKKEKDSEERYPLITADIWAASEEKRQLDEYFKDVKEILLDSATNVGPADANMRSVEYDSSDLEDSELPGRGATSNADSDMPSGSEDDSSDADLFGETGQNLKEKRGGGKEEGSNDLDPRVEYNLNMIRDDNPSKNFYYEQGENDFWHDIDGDWIYKTENPSYGYSKVVLVKRNREPYLSFLRKEEPLAPLPDLEPRELYNLDRWKKEKGSSWYYVDKFKRMWISEDGIWVQTLEVPAGYNKVEYQYESGQGEDLVGTVDKEEKRLTYDELPTLDEAIIDELKTMKGNYTFVDRDGNFYENDPEGNWRYVYTADPTRETLFSEDLESSSESSTDVDEASSSSPEAGDEETGRPKGATLDNPMKLLEDNANQLVNPLHTALNRFIGGLPENFSGSAFYYTETPEKFHLRSRSRTWHVQGNQPDDAFKIIADDNNEYAFEPIFKKKEEENWVEITETKWKRPMEEVKALLRIFGPKTYENMGESQKIQLRAALGNDYEFEDTDVFSVGEVRRKKRSTVFFFFFFW